MGCCGSVRDALTGQDIIVKRKIHDAMRPPIRRLSIAHGNDGLACADVRADAYAWATPAPNLVTADSEKQEAAKRKR